MLKIGDDIHYCMLFSLRALINFMVIFHFPILPKYLYSINIYNKDTYNLGCNSSCNLFI